MIRRISRQLPALQKVSEISDDSRKCGTTSLKNRYYLYNSKERLFEKLEMYHRIVYNQEQTFDFEGGVHMNYKEKLIELVGNIEDEAVLSLIYKIIIRLID